MNSFKKPNYSLIRYEVDEFRSSDNKVFEFYLSHFRNYQTQLQLGDLFNWLRQFGVGELYDIGLIYVSQQSRYTDAIYTLPCRSLWVIKKYKNPAQGVPEFIPGWFTRS